MLADVAQEVDDRHRSEPLAVVDHERLRRSRREVEEALELTAQRSRVGLDRGLVEQPPLGGLAGGIPDHARAATDDDDRPTVRTLQVPEEEDLQQVADVQGGGAGVEADVAADRPSRQSSLQALR